MQEVIINPEILSLDSFQESGDEINLNSIKSEIDNLIQALNNEYLLAKEQDDQSQLFILSTDICELVKQYILYLRNLAIEKIYAHAKFKSGIVTKNDYDRYNKEQHQEYLVTVKDFQKELRLALNQLTDQKHVKKIARDSELVNNPYEIYKDQFQMLKSQIQKILHYDLQLKNLVLRFNYLKNTIFNDIDMEKAKAEELHNSFDPLFNFITSESPELTQLEDQLKKIEKTTDTIRVELNVGDALVKVIDQLGTVELIKNYQQGILYLNEINTSTHLRRWIDYTIAPELRDINRRLRAQSEISSRFVHSLLAAQNSNDGPDFILTDKSGEIKKRKQEYLQILNSLIEDYSQLKTKISEHLSVESILRHESWNESLFLNTYTQVKSNTESIFSKAKLIFNGIVKNVHISLNRYDYNKPKLSAQVVEFLKLRTAEEKENLYQRIFFDSTRFKDHFLVERKIELTKTNEAIEAWEQGFGNSLLVYGMAQCGKSSFIQAVIDTYYFDQEIVIKPNCTLTVEGRKFVIQHNLDQTLTEIRKHLSVNQKYCIAIDDLESWFDSDFTLLSITKSIIKHIDRAQSNVFFLISANLRFVNRLDIILDFRSVFTWEIELSRMLESEFLITVLNRHETAKHVLTDRSNDPVSRSNLIKIAKQLFTANGEIVGSALQHWIGIINKSNQLIKKILKTDNLPFIVNEENIILMDLLLLHKSIPQIDLINMLPKQNRDFIRNQIGRLVKLNIIVRDQIGYLSIKPLIINDIYYQTSASDPNKEKFYHYLLGSKAAVSGESSQILEKIQQCLIFFPFKSDDSKVTIERLRDSIEISIKAEEMPSQVLKHLDASIENIQFEFKRNLS